METNRACYAAKFYGLASSFLQWIQAGLRHWKWVPTQLQGRLVAFTDNQDQREWPAYGKDTAQVLTKVLSASRLKSRARGVARRRTPG